MLSLLLPVGQGSLFQAFVGLLPEVWVQARSLGDPAEALLFDKVQPQDVMQGRLGDCWSFQLCLARFGTVFDSY